MGCTISLLSRVALFFVWITTSLVNHAFQGGWVLPLLGILFLPLTTLTYVIVYSLANGVLGWGWLWVVLALLIDLGAHGSGARANRHRLPGYHAAES